MFRFRFIPRFKKHKDISMVRKNAIDIKSLELSISLGKIDNVGDYEKKRTEIAFAITCFYINHRTEYDLGDFFSPEYWLILADEYLNIHGINLNIIIGKPKTVDDIFHKAKIVGFNNALEEISEELCDSVFERMAIVISKMIYDDKYDERRLTESARKRREREYWRSRCNH